MNASELKAYRKSLVGLMSRVERDRAQLLREALQPCGGEARGSEGTAPAPADDLGGDTFEGEQAFRVLQNEDHILEQASAALDRLDRGTFGVCTACQRRISQKRLLALPYASLCRLCARVAEAE